eukprot:TRINITY_DN211_c0_g1_i1.p1 TRINITY_DN211_c0_g1~~TRINITY_DN211_c0_g1_i1.p1  ORF type:complete len:406 (-),score=86.51 TRINITY_DN211_c0_g1_i1:124-1341(-)
MNRISSLFLFFVTIHACSYRTETSTTLRAGWNEAVRCTSDNQDPKCLIENQWAKLAPTGSLQMGCTSGFRLSFLSFENAYAFFPQDSQPAAPLNQSATNPIGNYTQFAASVFASTISIKLDESISTFGSCIRPLSTLYICDTSSCGGFYNKKISEVFTKAVNSLGNCVSTTMAEMNSTNTCLRYILDSFQGGPDLTLRPSFSSTVCPAALKSITPTKIFIEPKETDTTTSSDIDDEEMFSRCFPSGITIGGGSSRCSLPKVDIQSIREIEQYVEGESPNQRIQLSKQVLSLHYNLGLHACNNESSRIGQHYLCDNAPAECHQFYGHSIDEVLEMTKSPEDCKEVPEMNRCLQSINTVINTNQLDEYFSEIKCKPIDNEEKNDKALSNDVSNAAFIMMLPLFCLFF